MKIVPIKKANDPLFEKFWDVYTYSFPLHEKRTYKNQCKAVESGDCSVDAFLVDGSFVGFLIYWEFETFIYAEHFALAKEVRSNGYGSKILSTFIENHSDKCLILDIDPIVNEITERRRNFYFRLGFKQNPYLHIHPSYESADGERFELILMSHGRELTPQEFAEFKNTLYTKIITY
ncbi:MAG: GNAT family N-acetyltransferase [Rikenellaceae bacterium]